MAKRENGCGCTGGTGGENAHSPRYACVARWIGCRAPLRCTTAALLKPTGAAAIFCNGRIEIFFSTNCAIAASVLFSCCLLHARGAGSTKTSRGMMTTLLLLTALSFHWASAAPSVTLTWTVKKCSTREISNVHCTSLLFYCCSSTNQYGTILDKTNCNDPCLQFPSIIQMSYVLAYVLVKYYKIKSNCK